MHRFWKVTLAMLVMGSLVMAGLPALRGVAARPSAQDSGDASPCIAVRDKSAGPASVALGATVDVTLTVKASCPGGSSPLHVVLVLDASAAMQVEPNTEIRAVARQIISALDMGDNPATRVGVVSFNSSATILCQLTNDTNRARGCVDNVGSPEGETSIASGILAGIGVITTGRKDLEVPAEDIREVMVVIAGGPDGAGCGSAQRAAGQAKGHGILVISVCVGPNCDVQCMRSIPSSPHYYFEAPTSTDLERIFLEIAALLRMIQSMSDGLQVTGLSVTDRLPPNMAYVPGSAVPPPSALDATAGTLTWRFAVVPPDGLTLTLRVQPLEVGTHATNAGATGVLTDTTGRTGAFAFPDPSVIVVAPTPQPTSTDVPTPTGVPTATGTPTRAASLTPTAVSRVALYFPSACWDAGP